MYLEDNALLNYNFTFIVIYKVITCLPDKIRTYDLLLRRQSLYPTELQEEMGSVTSPDLYTFSYNSYFLYV